MCLSCDKNQGNYIVYISVTVNAMLIFSSVSYAHHSKKKTVLKAEISETVPKAEIGAKGLEGLGSWPLAQLLVANFKEALQANRVKWGDNKHLSDSGPNR